MKHALLYRTLKDNRVQCGLCYRTCLIDEGKRGYCLSRLNLDGTLYSLIYGVIAAIEPSPIEEKPLIHFHLGQNSVWHILRFFPKHQLADLPPTPQESLALAKRIGEEAGLRTVNIVSDKSCD